MLIISERQVLDLLPMAECIEALRGAFLAQESSSPPRIHLGTPSGPTLFKPASFLPAAGSGQADGAPATTHHIACKIVAVRPKNADINKPTVPATVLTVDDVTGEVSAIIAGTNLTGRRTAAASGLATDLMFAQPAASTGLRLLVYGAGLQGAEHVRAMLCVRPGISHVVVANRTLPRAAALCDELRAEFAGHGGAADGVDGADGAGGAAGAVSFEPAVLGSAAVAAALTAADLVCCCTNASEPLFDGSKLKPGCHVNGVGSYTPAMVEVGAGLVMRAAIVVDSDDAWTVGDLAQRGAPQAATAPSPTHTDQPRDQPASAGRIAGDLKQLLSGAIVVATKKESGVSRGAASAGGAPASDVTFFKCVGLAIMDVAAAAVVLANAERQGVGTQALL